MPHILHRDRWRRSPPPGWRIQFSHPLAQGLWSAQYFSEMCGTDALRGNLLIPGAAGVNDIKSRNYKGGRYISASRPSGGGPYWYGPGRTPALSATSDITLVALLGGDGRATFPDVRVKATSVYWQEGVPGIQEGNGTTNVLVAKFLGAGNVTVQAVGTSTLGVNERGKVVSAAYDNGAGIALWAEGRQEAFQSSALNLALVPDEVHMTSGTTILEYPPIVLGYARVLSDGEQRALSENPFQVLRPVRRPSFFVLSGGPIALVGAGAQSATAASTPAVIQTHALAGAAAASGTVASTGAVSSSVTLAGAAAVSETTASAGAVAQTNVVSAAVASSATAASGAAVEQTHILAAAPAQSATQASGAAVSQFSVLAGSAATSATVLSTGSVAQAHALAAAPAASATAMSAGAVAQTHVLAVAGAQSTTQASAGAVTSAGTWTGAPAVSETSASAAAIAQDHVLTAADAVSAGLLTSAQVTQVHVLTAAGAVSGTQASGGAVDTPAPGALVGSPAASSTGASAGSVTQTHLLAGASASSATALSSGTVSDGTQADVGTYEPVWFRARTVAPVRFLQ